ncbi:hypothetical protein MPSEU_000225700 [Mayamaea pseudoterrestris]|nr:hypothetical protein MPSEU_000225700 [Mayamaea pseudoterrestris]
MATNGKPISNGNTCINDVKSEMNTQPPALLRNWLRLSASVPSIRIGPLDVTITLLTIAALSTLRFAFMYMLIHVFQWPDAMISRDAAASLVGIFHSVLLVPALAACFLAHPYSPSGAMEISPLWYQRAVTALLQFCTGYMIYDGTLNILILKYPNYAPSDLMFLGHHLATTLYMTACRLLERGHQSAMMCMFLGELTNPFQNSYMVAEFAQTLECCNGHVSQLLFSVTECAFSSIYCLMRVIIGPILCLHITFDLWWRGRHTIPWGVLVVWTLLIWAVIIGSIPWIQDCWSKLQKYLPEAATALLSKNEEL